MIKESARDQKNKKSATYLHTLQCKSVKIGPNYNVLKPWNYSNFGITKVYEKKKQNFYFKNTENKCVIWCSFVICRIALIVIAARLFGVCVSM